jgi:hypothetical protein
VILLALIGLIAFAVTFGLLTIFAAASRSDDLAGR